MVVVNGRARVVGATGNAPGRRGGSLQSLDTKLPLLRRERFRNKVRLRFVQKLHPFENKVLAIDFPNNSSACITAEDVLPALTLSKSLNLVKPLYGGGLK